MNARLYTVMGKEHVIRVVSHRLTKNNHLILDAPEVESIKSIIKAGKPCTIEIDYVGDINVDVHNKLSGCRICDCGEIVCEKGSVSTVVKRSFR